MSPIEHPTWGGSRPNSGRPRSQDKLPDFSLIRALRSLHQVGGLVEGEAYAQSEIQGRVEKTNILDSMRAATVGSGLQSFFVSLGGTRDITTAAGGTAWSVRRKASTVTF
jgi:hypothetical protein